MRVLLVDDDPLVLSALNRTVLSRRPEWEVVLAKSGEMAVGWLTQTPFDMVMTDMQMPGMDGSTVLKMSQKLQPGAIRMVLSGHAPLVRILEAEGHYHRFIMKPIEPNQLMAILSSLSPEGLDEECLMARSLVAGLERVPSLRRCVDQLKALLEQPDPDLVEVCRVVAQDLGIATSILKLVNSAYLSVGHFIAGINEAVEYLGLTVLRELVLNRGIMVVATDAAPAGLSLEGLWGHSHQVALTASEWIRSATGDQTLAAQAFSVGLLHDVGKLVLAINPACNYRAVIEHGHIGNQSLQDLERQWLGTDHGKVGAQLLHLWALPESFSAVVKEQDGNGPADCTSLISLAVHCAHLLPGTHPSPDLFHDGSHPRFLRAATVETATSHWVQQLSSWRQTFLAVDAAEIASLP